MSLPILPDDAPVTALRGRLARYSLRLSVLEQCQLDCGYCRPGSTTSPTERDRWLTATHHARLAPLLLHHGVRRVRFTGGEPTLRADLVELVAVWQQAVRTANLDVPLGLTTNGLRLAPLLPSLCEAGLDGVTIHLDTLRADRVQALMGAGANVDVALAAAEKARNCGLLVKFNVVVQRGLNDDELHTFLDVGTRLGAEVRFVEQMNTGSASAHVEGSFISGAEVVQRLSATPRGRRHDSDPAALFVDDRGRTFGVIASDTEPFCSTCDRLRLTADGRLRGCLYEAGGVPVGEALRAAVSDAELAAVMTHALDAKRSHHPSQAATRVPFSMADIGG
jgi:cyclic pyranopterin phosphate synthase